MSSGTGGGGGGPQGLDVFTQQMMSKGPQAGGDGGALLNAIFKMFGVNGSNMLSTGIFANFKLESAGLQSQNAIVRGEGMSMKGGFIAQKLSEVVSKENMWNGITSAQVEALPIEAQQQIASIRDIAGEGMPVSAMSYGDLGTLQPMPTGGTMRDQGMGMMA